MFMKLRFWNVCCKKVNLIFNMSLQVFLLKARQVVVQVHILSQLEIKDFFLFVSHSQSSRGTANIGQKASGPIQGTYSTCVGRYKSHTYWTKHYLCTLIFQVIYFHKLLVSSVIYLLKTNYKWFSKFLTTNSNTPASPSDLLICIENNIHSLLFFNHQPSRKLKNISLSPRFSL